LAVIPRRAGDLPVLVHVVLSACPGSSTTQDRTATRDNAAAVLPSHYTPCSRHPDQPTLRSSIAGPTGPSVYASTDASRRHLQDSRPEWSRCLLSCGGLAPPTTCRFIPALGGLWPIRPLPQMVQLFDGRKLVRRTQLTACRRQAIEPHARRQSRLHYCFVPIHPLSPACTQGSDVPLSRRSILCCLNPIDHIVEAIILQ
jgi:hypothetical protein